MYLKNGETASRGAEYAYDFPDGKLKVLRHAVELPHQKKGGGEKGTEKAQEQKSRE